MDEKFLFYILNERTLTVNEIVVDNYFNTGKRSWTLASVIYCYVKENAYRISLLLNISFLPAIDQAFQCRMKKNFELKLRPKKFVM